MDSLDKNVIIVEVSDVNYSLLSTTVLLLTLNTITKVLIESVVL